jgi:hypothetical protein
MSRQNDDPGYRLPTGGVFNQDITKYTEAELEHEQQLAYEVLNDIHCSYPPWNGGVAITGMLKQNPDESSVGREQFLRALETWKLRLKRAEDELLERRLLRS